MTTRSPLDALTARERMFVDEYVKTMNVKQAAVAVGYSKKLSGNLSGNRMMQKPHVALGIAEALREKSLLARIDASWVLKRLARLADFSIKNFIVVDDNGRLYYDFAGATDDDWYCINEITIGATRAKHRRVLDDGEGRLWVSEVRIKTGDKMKALELVGKHVDVQAFKDRVDVSGTVQITEVTRRVVRPGDAPQQAPALPEQAQ